MRNTDKIKVEAGVMKLFVVFEVDKQGYEEDRFLGIFNSKEDADEEMKYLYRNYEVRPMKIGELKENGKWEL